MDEDDAVQHKSKMMYHLAVRTLSAPKNLSWHARNTAAMHLTRPNSAR